MPEALTSAAGTAGSDRRFDVTSLGEAMLRFSSPAGMPLASARRLDVNLGGAESNVCAALAGLGRRCSWVSRLPDNALGRLALRRLQEFGVDVSGVEMAPEGRVGLYFVELAVPPLPIRVTYDRAHSCFSQLDPAAIPWDLLLDTKILHLTGITPALCRSGLEVVQQAVARARERGVILSFDVNYRARLWSEAEAAAALAPLVREADLLLCGRKDAIRVFGLGGDEDELLDQLQELTGARHIVVSRGERGAIARSDGRTMFQPAIPITAVDRIGAGDAFAAGIIDGILDGSIEDALARGSALAAMAMAQEGDAAVVSRQEMIELTMVQGQEVLR